jgi:hypothetical protein
MKQKLIVIGVSLILGVAMAVFVFSKAARNESHLFESNVEALAAMKEDSYGVGCKEAVNDCMFFEPDGSLDLIPGHYGPGVRFEFSMRAVD